MATNDPETPETAAQKAERLAAEAAASATAAAAVKTAEALARGAVDAMGKAANGALDAVEKMLFGKVGGAEEAAKREAIADPIERLRAEHGLEARPAVKPPTREEKRQAAMDEARAQLDALKRARAGVSEPVARTDPAGRVPTGGERAAPTGSGPGSASGGGSGGGSSGGSGGSGTAGSGSSQPAPAEPVERKRTL